MNLPPNDTSASSGISTEEDIFARTLYGEAEAHNKDDAYAIACVIINRLHLGRWGSSIKAVCLQPWQFSCWNASDPNRTRILAASFERDAWLAECLTIARTVTAQTHEDVTQRSTHYYATFILTPFWAKGKKPVYRVAHRSHHAHLFFNDIDTPAPKSAKAALDQQRPLTTTRTVQAGRLATASTIALMGVEAMPSLDAAHSTITTTSSVLMPLIPLFPWMKWGLLGLILLGIALMMWARFTDRQHGIH